MAGRPGIRGLGIYLHMILTSAVSIQVSRIPFQTELDRKTDFWQRDTLPRSRESGALVHTYPK